MASLSAAAAGYEYQDLLVAIRLVDVVLERIVDVHVDEKLVDDDRFDDLTTVELGGSRVRLQFKHTENDDRPLTLSTFTNDGRGLRLDRLVACILADRAGPGRDAPSSSYRVVLRDRPPQDERLCSLLTPLSPDPGPFVGHLATTRLQFRADALWAELAKEPSSFSAVKAGLPTLTFKDLATACGRLVLELEAPAASLDLTRPDEAEDILLRRVRSEIGAESFPNAARHAVDVAAAFVSAARAARQRRFSVTPAGLLRRAQLRSDFGAVTRTDPVDRLTQVDRVGTVDDLLAAAEQTAQSGGCLLVTGPPGHGKSWACQQLLELMDARGWRVAEHYCFLGDADGERLERVLTEHLFGSLLARLVDDDAALTEGQLPRLAADEDALANCLKRARDRDPTRQIALVVDGLDHITRVRSPIRGASDPSFSVAEALATLDLPQGCALVVLSQPGPHLNPLEALSPLRRMVPALNSAELRQLAQHHGVIADGEPGRSIGASLPLEDEDPIAEFLGALAERSGGNALYATYLCLEALRADPIIADPTEAVRRLPAFDGTLEGYYSHLYGALDADAGWVAEVIAIATFGVSRLELLEMMPEFRHRLDAALALLAPVLVERPTQGGLRIYHESFGRFIRRRLDDSPAALTANLAKVTSWLARKGLFVDARAYRHLLPLMADAEEHDRVVSLVGRDFVEESIAFGFPASAIKANLAVAIGSAAALGAWPAIARYVELSRAAEAYENERHDTTLAPFADVYLALLGSSTVAERMLNEHRLVVSARFGLQMCAEVDCAGEVAPWREYMTGLLREGESDTTIYGEASDLAVAMAWVRGRLRLSSARVDDGRSGNVSPLADHGQVASVGEQFQSPMNWSDLAKWLDGEPLAARSVVTAVLDTHGLAGIEALASHLRHPGAVYLAVAELVAGGDASDDVGSVQQWAAMVREHDVGPRDIRRLLALGVDVNDVTSMPIEEARRQLLEITQRIQEPRPNWAKGTVEYWIGSCSLAARRDLLALDLAEGLIIGEGWYRCWLRFALALARAEASASDQSRLALVALDRLVEDLRPFVGDPRSTDLYPIHETIADTIGQAVRLLARDEWIAGIRTLKRVSDAISTTLWGELGGPVPIDFVLDLAVASAPLEDVRFVADLIDREIEEGAAGRYYSDLARYQLLAARLSLRSGNRSEAERHWRAACGLLAGYGWHKDITVYELLDPLDALISADPRRGRRCVADVQGLCERIPDHTDGRTTRGVSREWWRLLAVADPIALAELVSSGLLSECNEPNYFLYNALEDLWRASAAKVDPVIAGALRLALDTPLERDDSAALERLLSTQEANDTALQQLMVMLMARVDERPVSYPFTNSEQMLENDDKAVGDLNAIADAAGLPRSIAFRDPPPPKGSPFEGSAPKASVSGTEPEAAPAPFPAGAPGLGRAIRALRNRPYQGNDPGWSTARFANAIGYRLVELAGADRSQEAEFALHTLADFVGFGDGPSILFELGEGLERHGLKRLSAIAFALVWTRTRGHGGWLSFGGSAEIESLRRATTLDPEATLSVVAEEVQRFVLGDRHGTYGITQAIIRAFAEGVLPTVDSLTTAFEAWDEARWVIEGRAPIVHPADLPRYPYASTAGDERGECVGDLDAAFGLAIAAGMAHPSRERKRRVLVAINLLLMMRPALATKVIAFALGQGCDPATLCWLMSVVADRTGEEVAEITKVSTVQLLSLAGSEYLTVRFLARYLLGTAAPGLPPSATPQPELLSGEDRLWLPSSDDDTELRHERAEALVDDVAGSRIHGGERLLPGLRAAVVSRVSDAMESDSFKSMMKAQLQAFGDQIGKRWPDAYLVNEQTVEEILQSVAGGGRAAFMLSGEPLSTPESWEAELGSALLDHSKIPLCLEGTREPRPSIPAVPPPGSPWWAGVRSPCSVVFGGSDDEQVFATVSVEPVRSAQKVAGGPFDGWFWFATYESRTFSHPDFRRREDRLIGKRYRGPEVRDVDDANGLDYPPLTVGDLSLWRAEVEPGAEAAFASGQPLIGLDVHMKAAGDAHQGLGIPRAVLTPTASLLAVLQLRPVDPIGYHDEVGLGMGLVTWRSDYDVSDYHLPIARTTGCGVALRPDLLDRLVEILEARLILRDFVMADAEVAVVNDDAEGQ